jgi:hypothetical protein
MVITAGMANTIGIVVLLAILGLIVLEFFGKFW